VVTFQNKDGSTFFFLTGKFLFNSENFRYYIQVVLIVFTYIHITTALQVFSLQELGHAVCSSGPLAQVNTSDLDNSTGSNTENHKLMRF
jgi:hypothetical protein